MIAKLVIVILNAEAERQRTIERTAEAEAQRDGWAAEGDMPIAACWAAEVMAGHARVEVFDRLILALRADLERLSAEDADPEESVN